MITAYYSGARYELEDMDAVYRVAQMLSACPEDVTELFYEDKGRVGAINLETFEDV